MNKTLVSVIRWAIVVAMPFFLGFSTIRLFVNLAELYVDYEYGKDNFPRDLHVYSDLELERLGIERLSQPERKELALVAVDYLQRPEPPEEVIYLLGEQSLPGSNRPLYNEAELSHMVDVKRLTDGIGRLNWLAAAGVLGGLALLLWRPATRLAAYQAIFNGGVATTMVLLFIGLFIALAWNVFFVQFHELLFPPGTWTFAYTDGLIRLFPEKFWFDFGVLVSGTALSLGVLTALLGWFLLRRAATRAG